MGWEYPSDPVEPNPTLLENKDIKTLEDGQLLNLYVSTLSLNRLHSEDHGLKESKKYYLKRATELENEILSRMRRVK
jgi:hypothetical protein